MSPTVKTHKIEGALKNKLLIKYRLRKAADHSTINGMKYLGTRCNSYGSNLDDDMTAICDGLNSTCNLNLNVMKNKITETVNKPEVKDEPIEKRKCKFPEEKLSPTLAYSFSQCFLYNRINLELKFCNCTIPTSPKESVNRRAITELKNLRHDPPKEPAGTSERTLAQALHGRIRATGPITVATYMREVLLNPFAGYYSTKDNVFGTTGDFITAPEIGQIFGELVAVWCINELQKFNYDGHLQLIELGPGKGTLMHDVLRVFERFGLSKDRISVHLVEMSSNLQRIQAEKLCNGMAHRTPADQVEPFVQEGTTGSGINLRWYTDIVEVPKGFSIILANEFFDALPVHVFCREANEGSATWKEMLVDINPDRKEPSFRFIQSTKGTPYSVVFGKRFEGREQLLKDRKRIEVSFESEQIAQNIASRVEEHGGFGLIIDYGHEGDKTDTLRSFKSHKLHDPLDDPGSADLTVDVDFGFLKHFLEQDEKAFTLGPINQGAFLEAMEGSARLKSLQSSTENEAYRKMLSNGYDELTNPSKMGERFKLLSIFPSSLKEFLMSSNKVLIDLRLELEINCACRFAQLLQHDLFGAFLRNVSSFEDPFLMYADSSSKLTEVGDDKL
uniref:type II protein arginine methyltransferase n=1 Tax=Anopheles christyi TaxID=43041 RepID=A0A182K2L0_9DIPT